MKQKYFKLLIILLAVAIVLPQITLAAWWNPASWGVWGKIWGMFHKQQNNPVACTMEAKQCPDGSYVGRQGPKCEFASCPGENIVGGDRDEHGCIGSAGYSWCQAKQKCLRVWEENCNISGDVYPLFSDLKWSSSTAKTIQEPVSRISISGYEITVTATISKNLDAGKFFNYYKKLLNSGWQTDNNFAADGVTGSQMGYIKGNNYIVLNYSITPGKIISGANEPLQYTCPCQVKYSIFTGNKK